MKTSPPPSAFSPSRAGGLGLNITGANVVVVFDPSWNPAHDLQAQDRAYRLGQHRDVRVYRLITAGGIEENVYLRQVYKQQLSRNAVDGEKARRYFEAIQGQAKGELFGVANLFAVRNSDSDPASSSSVRCLTTEIFRRHERVEELVRGRRKRTEVMDNLLDYEEGEGDAAERKVRDADDPTGLADVVLNAVRMLSIAW